MPGHLKKKCEKGIAEATSPGMNKRMKEKNENYI